MLLFHFPLLEVYHLEAPCLRSYQKAVFDTRVCGRWDPSLVSFLGFMLCENKLHIEIIYVCTPKENDSLTLSSTIHRASPALISSLDIEKC